VIGGELEHEAVEPHGLFDAGGVDVTGGEAALFDGRPAVAVVAAVFLEVEVAVIGTAEAGHRREVFLDAFEKVEEGLPLVGELELRPESEVYVKILTEGAVGVVHGGLNLP
jgi:hypothetical protein